MTSTANTDRIAELHTQLETGIAELTTSTDWTNMLAAAARFHNYSFNNLMLIVAQNPDATHVAGYRTWQALGRQVRKGEHGIRILAPLRRKIEDETTGDTRQVIRGFTTATVFDITQTDGEPLPETPGPLLLEGEAPTGLWDGLAAQITAAGFTVTRGDCGQANGKTDFGARTVTVRSDVDDAQAVKTLAHELGHVLMHQDRTATDRQRGEVEAESVAYIVCAAAGLASDGYSLPYVGHWSDGDVTKVRETGDRVIRCATAILSVLDADKAELAAVGS